MGFYIIKGDLLKQEHDALVIPSQPSLKLEGVIGQKVADKCGEKLKLELSQYKNINISECVIANAYNLKCKKLILVANPKWDGGQHKEEYNLKQSYISCMDMANDFGLESIAFPLLSTGAYEFPKRRAIEIAIETILDYVEDYDLDVALVIYGESTYTTYRDLFKKYTIIGGHLSKAEKERNRAVEEEKRRFYDWYKPNTEKILEGGPEAKEFKKKIEFYITQKGLSKVECYSGIMSKAAFYNILKGSIPGKYRVVALGINMGLDAYEINDLLTPLGDCLKEYIEKDDIILRGIYEKKDVDEINKDLCARGIVPLGTLKTL